MISTTPKQTCPRCGSLVPAEQQRCDCGELFRKTVDDEPLPSEALVAQAEALYESYLSARVQRATKTLQAAKAGLLQDPANPKLIRQMREATQEIDALRVQLGVQTGRAEEARKKAEEARRHRTEPGLDVPSVSVTTTQVEPGPAFRDTQSGNATEVMQSLPQARLVEAHHSAEPAAVFRAAQAMRADQVAGVAVADTRRCPKCLATLDADGRCHSCGHALSTDAALPEFLTQEEIAALRRPPTRR